MCVARRWWSLFNLSHNTYAIDRVIISLYSMMVDYSSFRYCFSWLRHGIVRGNLDPRRGSAKATISVLSHREQSRVSQLLIWEVWRNNSNDLSSSVVNWSLPRNISRDTRYRNIWYFHFGIRINFYRGHLFHVTKIWSLVITTYFFKNLFHKYRNFLF